LAAAAGGARGRGHQHVALDKSNNHKKQKTEGKPEERSWRTTWHSGSEA